MRRFLIVFAVVANLVLVDAVSKEIAAALLKGRAAVSVIPGLFSLAYVENRGCAWGMLQGQVWPLAVFGIAALALLVWRRRDVFAGPEGSPRWAAVLGAVAAPGNFNSVHFFKLARQTFGNRIPHCFGADHIIHRGFYRGSSHFPCFNFADTCICVGAGMIVLASLLTPRRRKGGREAAS